MVDPCRPGQGVRVPNPAAGILGLSFSRDTRRRYQKGNQMQINNVQNVSDFRSIGELTAQFILELADRDIVKNKKDPLTPELRASLTAQAGGK